MQTTAVPSWLRPAARFGISGATSAIAALGSVVRGKVLAIWLGPTGVGIWGQIYSGQTWLGTLTTGGLSLPMSHAIAVARGAGDAPAVRRAVWTAGIAVGLAILVVCGAGLALAPAISTALLGTPEHAVLVRLSMLGVAGFAAQVTLQGLWAGFADVRAPLTYALVGNAVAISTVLLLVPRFGVAGAVLGMACMFPTAIAGMLWIHRRRYREAFVPAPSPKFDRRVFTRLLHVAAASVGMALFDQGVLLATRSHYVRLHGTAATGLLQVALGLAVQMGGLFYAYLGGYAFGRISGLTDIVAIRDYTRRQWRAVTSLAALLAAFVVLAGRPLLHLLYSAQFDSARGPLAWMLLGEFCKVGGQVLATGALTVGGVRLWLPIGLGYTSAVGLGYLLATHLGAGPYSLPYAYAAAGFVGLVIPVVTMSRRGVTLAPRDLALVTLEIAALAALALRFGH